MGRPKGRPSFISEETLGIRVCSILSPHKHKAGAEGQTVIVHNTDAMAAPDDDEADEGDSEE